MAETSDRDSANRRLARRLIWVVAGAVLFTASLVPLYNVLCQVTGFNGKTKGAPAQMSKSMKVDESRWVTVEFIGNTMSGLSWDFYPKQASIRIHPGQIELATYFARNVTDKPATGQAVPSVSPGQAAPYFKKIECFCFQRQELMPGEIKEMPLTFYVSPDLPKGIETITLSYAFYKAVK
jgi:cytochrome c oxidase assembly protein subunit 11